MTDSLVITERSSIIYQYGTRNEILLSYRWDFFILRHFPIAKFPQRNSYLRENPINDIDDKMQYCQASTNFIIQKEFVQIQRNMFSYEQLVSFSYLPRRSQRPLPSFFPKCYFEFQDKTETVMCSVAISWYVYYFGRIKWVIKVTRDFYTVLAFLDMWGT